LSPIPWEKLIEGIEKCLRNSQRLFSSAETLVLKEEFIPAICLFILALEEIGKGIFLLRYLKAKKDVPDSQWKKYRYGSQAHIRKLEEVRKFTGLTVGDWSSALNQIKLNGFYVDWIENKWRSPEESSPIITIMELHLALLREHTKEAWNQLEKELSLQLKQKQ